MAQLESVPFSTHQMREMATFIGTCEEEGWAYEVTQSSNGCVWYVTITGLKSL